MRSTAAPGHLSARPLGERAPLKHIILVHMERKKETASLSHAMIRPYGWNKDKVTLVNSTEGAEPSVITTSDYLTSGMHLY